MALKEKVTVTLDNINNEHSRITRSMRSNPVSQTLGGIFFWQELLNTAKTSHKQAWSLAQDRKILPDNDAMRVLGKGEHIVTEAGKLTCLATVQNPRKSLDLEAFLLAVSEQHGVPIDKLAALAVKCRKDSEPPLEKRVVEFI